MPSILTSGPPCHLIAFLLTDIHLLKIVGPPIQEVVQNIRTSYLTPIHSNKHANLFTTFIHMSPPHGGWLQLLRPVLRLSFKIVGPPIQEVVQNIRTSYLTPIHSNSMQSYSPLLFICHPHMVLVTYNLRPAPVGFEIEFCESVRFSEISWIYKLDCQL